MTIQPRTQATMTVEQGLLFMASHLQEPIWPRNISTKTTEGRQILVNSREEALARFAQSNYLDCRISAYPPNILENPSETQKFVGLQTITPTTLIIMIDLDKCNFKTDRGFNMALTRTLNNIRNKLNAFPTILWSGRGYHIILPLNSNGIILETVKEFEGIPNISLRFLRYAELSLSLKKSDPQHNNTVSFNNCLLRIPGSINSKNNQPVTVLQKWDNHRLEINYLLAGFTRYIINEKYIELLETQKRKTTTSKYLSVEDNNDNNKIIWIERLLHTPLAEHRKYCIWRILTPYLLNKRKLSYQVSFSIIKQWLDNCSQLRRLDFNISQKINDGLNGACEGYMPIGYEKLKEENPELYLKLN